MFILDVFVSSRIEISKYFFRKIVYLTRYYIVELLITCIHFTNSLVIEMRNEIEQSGLLKLFFLMIHQRYYNQCFFSDFHSVGQKYPQSLEKWDTNLEQQNLSMGF